MGSAQTRPLFEKSGTKNFYLEEQPFIRLFLQKSIYFMHKGGIVLFHKTVFKHTPVPPRWVFCCVSSVFLIFLFSADVYAAEAGGGNMWAVGKELIINLYNKIAGISTVLAALMSAVAVLGAKLSNNQHKVDQAWDWLKRIWIAWAIINGIGAFIAYIQPLFNGVPKIDGF